MSQVTTVSQPSVYCIEGNRELLGDGMDAPGNIAFTEEALKVAWEATDRACSRRLQPFLPELIQVLR